MKTSFEIRSKIAELKAAYRALFDGINEENKADTEAKAETVMAEIDSLETRAANFEKIEASDAAFETRAKAKRPTVEATVISAGADEVDSDMDAYRSYLRGETRTMTAAGNPFAIPASVQSTVKNALDNTGNVLPNLNILYSNDGSALTVAYSDDTTNMGSYLGESNATALTGTDVPYTYKTLGAWDIVSGEIGISDKFIRDSGFDVVSNVNNTVFKRLAKKLEKEVLVGDGATGHAEGVFTVANVAVTSNSSANAAQFAADIFTLQTAVAPYEANAKWYLHSSTLNAIRGLTDSTGRTLLAEGLNTATPTILCGKPVVISDFLPAFGANAIVLGYGDIGEATTTRIVNNMTMDVFTDSKYKAVLQTGFQGHVSFDSKVTNGSAFKVLKRS